jgi:hypothetical protein
MVDRRVPGAQKGELLWKCPSGDYEVLDTRRPEKNCPVHPLQDLVPEKLATT